MSVLTFKYGKNLTDATPFIAGTIFLDIETGELFFDDPTSGKQPLLSEDGNLILAANGEIYNHQELRKQFEGNYNFQTMSDCEVILPLYKEKGAKFLDEMNGIFGLKKKKKK